MEIILIVLLIGIALSSLIAYVKTKNQAASGLNIFIAVLAIMALTVIKVF